jgi:hypothetical protein
METVEILELAAKIATPLAAIFAAIALILNARAIRLQRKSLRANLFNDIRRRVENLEDQFDDIKADDKEKMEAWYFRLFNVFESFAFYANHGYLEKEMVHYYEVGIDDCTNRLIENYPDLIAYFKKRHSGEFCELEQYFRTVLEKDLPF